MVFHLFNGFKDNLTKTNLTSRFKVVMNIRRKGNLEERQCVILSFFISYTKKAHHVTHVAKLPQLGGIDYL